MGAVTISQGVPWEAVAAMLTAIGLFGSWLSWQINRIHKRIDDHMAEEEETIRRQTESISLLARSVSYIAGRLGMDDPKG